MTANWLTTANARSFRTGDVPSPVFSELRGDIMKKIRGGMRVVLFFGTRHADDVTLYVVLAEDDTSELLVSSSRFPAGDEYQSLTPDVPSFHLFEREFWEDTGIRPVGHPWLKPVRSGIDTQTRMGDHPFFSMDGREVHEVAVGPVHAGVIEPGHFRFQCTGETVHHLEIALGYQHRGVESLFLQGDALGKTALAESITYDAVAHASCYAHAVEALAACDTPDRALAIRAVALEMERVGVHIGNLSALANDVGYLSACSFFQARRTAIINALLSFSGSRFGRGLIRPGGVVHDIDAADTGTLVSIIDSTLDDVIMMGETMFDSAGVRSRFERTGIVTKRTAHAAGLVGVAAKASGLPRDIRSAHPFGAYRERPIHAVTLDGGDVFSRGYIRFLEIQQSSRFIREALMHLPRGDILSKPPSLAPDRMTIAMVEGVRGETIHAVITDAHGAFARYKVKDASFNNWFGLALALRGEGVSDFPLCNKSFDLSYSGHDL